MHFREGKGLLIYKTVFLICKCGKRRSFRGKRSHQNLRSVLIDINSVEHDSSAAGRKPGSHIGQIGGRFGNLSNPTPVGIHHKYLGRCAVTALVSGGGENDFGSVARPCRIPVKPRMHAKVPRVGSVPFGDKYFGIAAIPSFDRKDAPPKQRGAVRRRPRRAGGRNFDRRWRTLEGAVQGSV